jgi:hypothetical protein
MKPTLALLLTVILCSCSSTSPNVKRADSQRAADKFRLQLQFKQGEAHLQRMTMEQVITQTIEGENIVINQTMGFDMLQEVLDVDTDGVANLKVTYTAARMKHASMMGNFIYDSANPPQELPPQAMSIAALVGKSFTMKMKANGEILALGGLDKLLEDTVNALELPDGPMKRALAKALREQYGEVAMKESMQQASLTYPDKPLAVGDSWEHTAVTTRGFAASMKNRYTVASRKNGVVTLDIHSQVTDNPKGEPMDMGVIKLRYKISGEQKGTSEVDAKTGQAIRSNVKQSMSGTVQVIGDDDDDAPEEWPISIESTISIEVTRKK